MPTDCCIIYTTTNDQKVADMITNALIKEKLAKCIQIENIISTFEWEKEIKSYKELRLSIKTTKEQYKKIESKILTLHNYKLPEIICLDISDGFRDYINWLSIE